MSYLKKDEIVIERTGIFYLVKFYGEFGFLKQADFGNKTDAESYAIKQKMNYGKKTIRKLY